MALVLLCDEGDFDEVSGECAAPYYGEATALFPVLSIEDAHALGWQIALVLVIAFGLRIARRVVERA